MKGDSRRNFFFSPFFSSFFFIFYIRMSPTISKLTNSNCIRLSIGVYRYPTLAPSFKSKEKKRRKNNGIYIFPSTLDAEGVEYFYVGHACLTSPEFSTSFCNIVVRVER